MSSASSASSSTSASSGASAAFGGGKGKSANDIGDVFAAMMAGLMSLPNLANFTQLESSGNGDFHLELSNAGNGNVSGSLTIDPSHMVIPDSVAQDLSQNGTLSMSSLSDLLSANGFPSGLLEALTTGTPAPASQTANQNIVSATLCQNTDGTTTQTTSPTNPLLSATGISPQQMAAIKDKIAKDLLAGNKATVALPTTAQSAQSATTTTSQQPPPVTLVSLTPPPTQLAASDMDETLQNVSVATLVASGNSTGTTSAKSPAQLAASSSATAVTTPDETANQPTAMPEFDPVEFRIAQSANRPGSRMLPYEVSEQNQNTATETLPVTVDAKSGHAATPILHVSGTMDTESLSVSGHLGAAPKTSGSNDESGLIMTDGLLASAGAASPSATSNLTNPILQSTSSTQSHPAVEAAAATIQKNAKQDGPQTLAIQLDPPELGRLQVKMKYEKGEPLKVHLVLEKADTMAMFQRNAHALENTLTMAGIKTDSSSLSFELSQDGSAFQQAMGNSGQDQSGSNSGERWAASSDTYSEPIESSLGVYLDPGTGLAHYSLVV